LDINGKGVDALDDIFAQRRMYGTMACNPRHIVKLSGFDDNAPVAFTGPIVTGMTGVHRTFVNHL